MGQLKAASDISRHRHRHILRLPGNSVGQHRVILPYLNNYTGTGNFKKSFGRERGFSIENPRKSHALLASVGCQCTKTDSIVAELMSGVTRTMNSERHNYATVCEWDEKWTRELSGIYRPYVQVTDAYAELVCEIVDIIGTEKPSSQQDVVVRDLLADVFDSLHEARRIILTGKCCTAYPVSRRVYEALSLLALCALDRDIAAKWESGKEIWNNEVKRNLCKHSLGESEDSIRKLASFFNLGAHPNRAVIPRRFLGEGNEFVLGSVGAPNLALVTEHCTINLRMWFWLTAVLLRYFQGIVDAARPDFVPRYLRVADAAQKIQSELEQNYKRLLHEERNHYLGASDA